MMEKIIGLTLIKRIMYELKKSLSENNNPKQNGFSLISLLTKTTQ